MYYYFIIIFIFILGHKHQTRMFKYWKEYVGAYDYGGGFPYRWIKRKRYIVVSKRNSNKGVVSMIMTLTRGLFCDVEIIIDSVQFHYPPGGGDCGGEYYSLTRIYYNIIKMMTHWVEYTMVLYFYGILRPFIIGFRGFWPLSGVHEKWVSTNSEFSPDVSKV